MRAATVGSVVAAGMLLADVTGPIGAVMFGVLITLATYVLLHATG